MASYYNQNQFVLSSAASNCMQTSSKPTSSQWDGKRAFSPILLNAAISVSHSMTFNIFAKFNLCKISCLVVLRAVLLILAVYGHHGDWHWKRQPQGSWVRLASPALLCCTGLVEQPLLCGQKGYIYCWQISIFNWSTEEAAAVFLWPGKLQGFGIW